MSRRTPEELAGIALGLVYIAGNLPDAQAVEQALTEMCVDYLVNLDQYTVTGVNSGSAYLGAFMYVPIDRHEECRAQLEGRGLADTVRLDKGEATEESHGA